MTKFRTDVALREKSSDSMFSDKLCFIYLSLPFFDKSEEECETGFEKWIYVLKYMKYWKDCLLRHRRRYSII